MAKIHNFKIRRIRKAKRSYHILGILGILILTLATYVLGPQPAYYQASVLNLAIAPAFNGTTYPIKKIPNWAKLTEEERKLKFADLPAEKIIDIPAYKPEEPMLATSDLQWNNPVHDAIRNILITYSVPYLGNYKLTFKENAGSHPAVDIKVPYGTPVYAIANGVVTKISPQDSGFGKHIVLGHYQAPTLEDESIKENLYSSYSHLSEIFVAEGDIVLKGQKIGAAGITGTATTPHLHFQIDKDTVDWHPYWPFTWEDTKNANLSFTEAINQGLGLEAAKKNTVNPLKYVQKYLSYEGINNSPPTNIPPPESNKDIPAEEKPETPIVVDDNAVVDNNTVNDSNLVIPDSSAKNNEPPKEVIPPVITPAVNNNPLTLETPVEKIEPPKVNNEPIQPNFTSFEFKNNNIYWAGDAIPVNIYTKDAKGNSVISPKFPNELEIILSEPAGTLSKNKLMPDSFANGETAVIIQTQKAGKFTIMINFNDQIFSSGEIKVYEKTKTPSAFKFQTLEALEINKPTSIAVFLIDSDNKTIPIVKEYITSARIKVIQGKASVDPVELNKDNFIEGIANIKIIPEEVPVVLEIQGGYLYGKSEALLIGQNSANTNLTLPEQIKTPDKSAQIFTDVGNDNLHFAAIKSLKDQGIIGGYPDGSFQPEKEVSRVEALKVIFMATAQKLDKISRYNFSDTDRFSWYALYVSTAFRLKVVRGYPDGTFKPTNLVSRVEFLKILFNAYKIDINPVVKAKPYSDIGKLEWFAPYVQLAKELNLFDKNLEKFKPGKALTRGEMAEIIFRMQKNVKKG